jgi:hypothetical protein
MCEKCDERAAKAKAGAVRRDLGAETVGAMTEGTKIDMTRPARQIVVQEVENGFLVTFKSDPKMYALLSSGLAGFPNENVFVAANLEAVTDIILTEGRKSR